jgi:hypothetical protein
MECGHSLLGIASGSACPECGTVTADAERVPQPLASPWLIALRMLWPVPIIVVTVWTATAAAGQYGKASDMQAPIVMLGTALAFAWLVTPATVAFGTVRLVQRLPRRARWAPLLLFVPRIVAMPVLTALAGACIATIAGFGACLVGLPFLRMGAG